jgi:hypothetical protein
MTVVAAPLTAEGQTITHPAGRVTVVVTVIRPGHAYRAAAHHTGTAGTLGAEIDCLTASYPTEAEARQAARRIVHAFRDQPGDLPFTALVERALASIAEQLDDAIARAMGGGDGTGRNTIPLGRLTAAREALRTPAERIAEQELVERLRADLATYDVDARYRAACEQPTLAQPTPNLDDNVHSPDWYAGYAQALHDHQHRVADADALDEAADEAIASYQDLRQRIAAGPGRAHLRVIAGGAA